MVDAHNTVAPALQRAVGLRLEEDPVAVRVLVVAADRGDNRHKFLPGPVHHHFRREGGRMVILVLYNKLQLGSLHSGEALLRARAVLRRVTVGQWLTGEGSLISCGCHRGQSRGVGQFDTRSIFFE